MVVKKFKPVPTEPEPTCYHSNIRFENGGPTICPDCHVHVWPHEMVNIILDSIHMYLPHRIGKVGKDRHRERG